jgi:hypothetical protein
VSGHVLPASGHVFAHREVTVGGLTLWAAEQGDRWREKVDRSGE